MDISRLRFLLAVIVVGGFLIIVGMIIASTIFLGFDHDFAIEVLEEVAKVMAGFIGLIIGYYFTQRRDAGSPSSDEPDSNSSDTTDNSNDRAS